MKQKLTDKKNRTIDLDQLKEHKEMQNALRQDVNAFEKKFTEEINSKIEKMKDMFSSQGIQQQIDASYPDLGSLDAMILDLPSELINLVNEEIEFCLSHDCFPEELKKRVGEKMKLLQLAYKDSRRYLDMFGRNYQELLLSDFIREICDIDYTEADWHRIARLNFSINGLKTINYYGVEGHSTGNELLRMFADILKNGRTVRSLEALGIRVIPSAEGEDNFGWILYGPYDLRLLLSVAERLLIQEAQEADVSHMIDFTTDRVQEALQHLGDKANTDSHFRLMASVGSTTLGEVLESLELPEGRSYDHIAGRLMTTMFKVADERSRNFKNDFKKAMKEENPTLYALYARSNASILEERLKELEAEVRELRGNL